MGNYLQVDPVLPKDFELRSRIKVTLSMDGEYKEYTVLKDGKAYDKRDCTVIINVNFRASSR